MDMIEAKLKKEFLLASLRQDLSRVGFENAERFRLGEIKSLAQKLPEIDALVPMATGVDQKVLHNYIPHKFK